MHRYGWMLCAGAIFYSILIYASVELLDRVWSEEQLLYEDQLPIEQLRNMDHRARSASHGKLPNGKLRPRYKNPNKASVNKSKSYIKNPVLIPKFKAPKELLLPKPIINVGFPKAGTSTIFSFFHCNGLKAQHWYCCEDQKHPSYSRLYKLMSSCVLRNMASQKPIFDNCGDYDVYTEINGPRHSAQSQDNTQLDDGTILSKLESTELKRRILFPQHHHLDKIHDQYPNATFILHKRDTESWIQSVLDWNAGLQYHILNEFYEKNATRFLFENVTVQHEVSFVDPIQADNRTSRVKKLPFGNSSKRRNLLKTVYEYHMQHVRDWVASHPSHALIEIDIAAEDTGKTLANAFGLHEECWGHFNQNKQGNLVVATRGKPDAATAKILQQRAQELGILRVSGQVQQTESTTKPIDN